MPAIRQDLRRALALQQLKRLIEALAFLEAKAIEHHDAGHAPARDEVDAVRLQRLDMAQVARQPPAVKNIKQQRAPAGRRSSMMAADDDDDDLGC